MTIKVVKKGKLPSGREVKLIRFPKGTKIKTIDKRFGKSYSKGLTGLKRRGKGYQLLLIKRKKKKLGGTVF